MLKLDAFAWSNWARTVVFPTWTLGARIKDVSSYSAMLASLMWAPCAYIIKVIYKC